MSLPQTSYSRPRGTRDLPPRAWRRVEEVERRLLRVTARYGCQRVQVPLVEYLDLYEQGHVGARLRHALLTTRLVSPALFPAADVRGELLHDAALRPDFTTALTRMYFEQQLHGEGGEPVRWAYAGDVFRNEGPPHRLQFRQVGAEVLGTPALEADVEVLQIAAAGVEELGLQGWSLLLSHTGLLRAVLRRLDVPEARLDRVARGVVEIARARHRLRPRVDLRPATELAALAAELEARLRLTLELRHQPDEVDAILEAEWDGLEDPTHLLELWWRETAGRWRSEGLSEQAIRWIHDFLALPEQAEACLEGLRDLLQGASDSSAAQVALDELERVCADLSPRHGSRLRISPAVGRGLAYYTGLIFEVEADTGQAEAMVCRGGRYARLPEAIWERARRTRSLREGRSGEVSSGVAQTGVGCAFWVDRLDAALGESLQLPPAMVDAYVLATSEEELRRASRLAEKLRRAGCSVLLPLPDPSGQLPDVQDQARRATTRARIQLSLAGTAPGQVRVVAGVLAGELSEEAAMRHVLHGPEAADERG